MKVALIGLFLAGHLAAPFGVVFAAYHLIRQRPLIAVYCVMAGFAACGILSFLLALIGYGFFETYAWAAWLIAFFAGYGTVAATAFTANMLRKLLAPTADELAAARVRIRSNWRSSRLGQSDMTPDA